MRKIVMQRVRMFEKWFDNLSIDETVDLIEESIKNGLKINIHTVNVDHLIIANKNKDFEEYMLNAEIVLADGMPIVWYSKLIKNPLKERVTGVDLSERLISESIKRNFKIFLLGGGAGVAEKCVEKMTEKYGNVNIVGTYCPSPEEISSPNKSDLIVNKINSSGANILLVALGAPKQELWIKRYKNKLNSNVNIGVGATFDFLSGNVKRANIILQRMGLEWFYRMLTDRDPKRLIKRYLINDSYFLVLCLKDIIKRIYR
jgi:N-acetylglucosaminyldiphosphoundecaprenol N-acetyl-beta-D-mannosaminyltransferase